LAHSRLRGSRGDRQSHQGNCLLKFRNSGKTKRRPAAELLAVATLTNARHRCSFTAVVPRAVRVVAVLLLSLSLGLHWVVLQSVAWTTMLIDRTQSSSFVTALRTTFDGKHPCRICKAVSAGKSAEKNSAGAVQTVKLELLAAGSVTPSLHPPLPLPGPSSLIVVLHPRAEVPIPPPPRV
jgi:hypothetical protein